MSKFYNISTDNTLGGSGASNSIVSSQKAVKEYVDSQTGTAPSFSNITGQPTDNANLATALNAKQDLLTAGTDLEIVRGSSVLPSGYTQLEYIEGTSNVQYINTGIVPTTSMKIYVKFGVTSITSGASFSPFGSRETGGQSDGVGVFVGSGANTRIDSFYFIASASDRWQVNSVASVGDVYETTFNNSTQTLVKNGTSLGSHTYTPVNSTTQPMYVNGLNNAGALQSGQWGGRIYRFTVTGVADMIPAKRNSDSVVGMYDIIRNQFYTNAGTGSFTAGGVVGDTATINFTNDTGYITSSALSPYALSSSLATVATSGSYNDLSDKPTIPTVNNATLTITQGGVSKGTFTANAGSDVTIALDAGGGSGSDRNIGEIVASTIPLTDAGLHLLDGSLISGSGSYAEFVTYVAGLVSTYPDIFETEVNWQTAVTTYGVCGKFVYDSVNNTVRLPKITGFTEGTIDPTVLGDLVQAGLPNITGAFGGCESNTSHQFANGAFNITGYTSGGEQNGSGTWVNFGFDASRSSSIYGNSSTVQPQTIKVLYYIVMANKVKTQIEVDIDEIATDLNGKADVDLSNCTKPYIIETYVNGTSWYRVYSDGWCEQGGEIPLGASSVTFLKPFKDANYFCHINYYNTTSSNNMTFASVYTHTQTANGFTCVASSVTNKKFKAEGYIS